MKRLSVLIIENDKDRISSIEDSLGEHFFKFRIATNWQIALELVSTYYFDLVILSYKLSNSKDDAIWFLDKAKEKDKTILEKPLIFSITAMLDGKIDEDNLREMTYRCVNKDSDRYLYEMEMAIIELVPGVFYIYKEKLQNFFQLYREIKGSVDSIEKNREDIQELRRELKVYVKWENFAETLGFLVGAFSLAIGIIITVITLLFKDEIVTKELNFPANSFLVVFALVVLGTWTLSYIYYKKKIMKKVEDRLLDLKINDR